MILQNKINILIFLFLSISYIKSSIILPFKELKKDEFYDFKDVEELLEEVSYLNLYSELYIGASPHKLPLLFKPNIDYFAIIENNLEQLISSDNYVPSSSESLKNLENNYNLIRGEQILSFSTETFHFLMAESDMSSIYSDKNKGKIDANNYHTFKNIKFLNTESKNKNYIGILGFSYTNLEYEKFNFIKELQQKSLISSTVWSVDFPDIDEDTFTKGNIIIGELPHIYNQKYYKENQYFTVKAYSKIANDTNNDWQIEIDSGTIIKKYYENTHKKEIGTSMSYLKTISIGFGSYMMYAPKKLFDQLSDLYFYNLFDARICDYKKIKTENDKITIIFCDKELFDRNEQMNFPTIFFDIQNLGGTFELTYKDVFMTKNDKIFFLIAFSSKRFEHTIKLGQIFLYKYKFTFDYDNNEVGFYRTNLEGQKVIHRIKRAFRGKIFLVILLLIIISGSIYYFHKKGYIIKKRVIDYNTANKNISHLAGENIEQGYELKNED